ncbi:MAG: VCBS repeat-containing protein [Verrucomicrobiales bacterium]|nr:VCBS repeat-containing protein [Verrucomicrobiales bacterium]
MKTSLGARSGPRLHVLPHLRRIARCVALLSWSLAWSWSPHASLRAGLLPHFEGKVISTAVKYGYQMIAVDLNADGKKDLLAIDEQSTELAWLENPSWTRHVLATDVPRPLNAACWDVDGDGIPEVALAYRFEPRPSQSIGNLVLLTHGADVRQPWTSREIDRVPTAHRIRWMDPEGLGKKVLLLGPMVGKSFPPAEGDSVPIYLYRPGTWQRETISTDPRGILHAINPVPWDGSPREQLLAASYAGLHRLEFARGQWQVSLLTPGDPRPWPLSGSSEVRLGHLEKRRLLVTIEPWHGHQVVVYLPEGDQWKRVVIEDAMENGHGLAVGDLDGDGRDEIVSGFRGKGFHVSLFQATDPRGVQWRKTVLDDGGIAAADCVIEDFNGDRLPDIACVGASTGNIKLYLNTGKPRAQP